MPTSTLTEEPQAVRVETDDTRLTVYMEDGRVLSVPLYWYPRLAYGTAEERAACSIFSNGEAIEWPLLDEHLSVAGLLAGRRSGEGKKSFSRWKAELDRRRAEGITGPWVEAEPMPAWWKEG